MNKTIAELLIADAKQKASNPAVSIGIAVLCGIVFAYPFWNVGARSPVDLPYLFVACAVIIPLLALAWSLAKRRSSLQKLSAEDVIGVTPVHTPEGPAQYWLHFRNSPAMSVVAPSNVAPAEIEAIFPNLPKPARKLGAGIAIWPCMATFLISAWFVNRSPVTATAAQLANTRAPMVLSGILAPEPGAIGYEFKIEKDGAGFVKMKFSDSTGEQIVYLDRTAASAWETDVGAGSRPARITIGQAKTSKMDGAGMAEFRVYIVNKVELLADQLNTN